MGLGKDSFMGGGRSNPRHEIGPGLSWMGGVPHRGNWKVKEVVVPWDPWVHGSHGTHGTHGSGPVQSGPISLSGGGGRSEAASPEIAFAISLEGRGGSPLVVVVVVK